MLPQFSITRLLLWFKSFNPSQQPLMSRPAFSYEMGTAITFSLAVGLTEGSVIGILAKKTFDVSPLLFAVIMASGALSNITSFLWARIAKGRRKIPVICTLMFLSVLSIGSVALLPLTPTGGLLLTILVLVSRALLAGIVTLRSIVWRQNYSRNTRGTITGKLALLASLVVASAPLIVYRALDLNEQAFRVLYPLAALYAGIGIFFFRKIRIRGEKALLQFERGADVEPVAHGAPAKLYEYDPEAEKANFISVLKEDLLFRRYMIAQFILGMSNISALTVFVYCVEEMTVGTKSPYFLSILLTTAIPFLLATVSLPYWSELLDRVHITRFRVTQVWLFTAYQILVWLGVLYQQLWLLFVSTLFIGLARGGAMIAWQLGHNDFASRKMVSLYMGIHVTLTGVRGASAPFIGILLYAGWNALNWGPIHIPPFSGIGPHVFLIAMAGNTLASFLFWRLAGDVEKQPDKRGEA